MDGLVLWLGLSAVSLTVTGLALSLPMGTAPDASALAQTVDEVATSEHRVVATVRPRADRLRLRLAQVSLRTGAGTDHGTLVAADPVPAWNGSLRAVLEGRPPESRFRSERTFRQALARARQRMGDWRPAPDRLRIRRVSWRGTNVTLVG